MKGKVNSRREASVRIRACGRMGLHRIVTVVIDTGYSGSLTLPPRVIRALRLKRIGRSDAELGDGPIAAFAVFAGTVVWAGERVAVEVDEANTGSLVGMALLEGFRLTVHVEPGGAVTISPLR